MVASLLLAYAEWLMKTIISDWSDACVSDSSGILLLRNEAKDIAESAAVRQRQITNPQKNRQSLERFGLILIVDHPFLFRRNDIQGTCKSSRGMIFTHFLCSRTIWNAVMENLY
jgi:hypothetical protein